METLQAFAPYISIIISGILGVLTYLIKGNFEDIKHQISAINSGIVTVNKQVMEYALKYEFIKQYVDELNHKHHDTHNIMRRLEVELTSLKSSFVACQQSCDRCNKPL